MNRFSHDVAPIMLMLRGGTLFLGRLTTTLLESEIESENGSRNHFMTKLHETGQAGVQNHNPWIEV